MRKNELQAFGNIQSLPNDSPLLQQPPRTAQQHYFLTYAAIHFLKKGIKTPQVDDLLTPANGSFTQLLLKINYMKFCIDSKLSTQNTNFYILHTLILWMENLQKLKANPKPNLMASLLLPKPENMLFHHYQQLLVYFNYVASDMQQLIKNRKFQTNQLLQLLQLALPRVYYNVVLPPEHQNQPTRQVLFYDHSAQYFIRTRVHYHLFCKNLINSIIATPNLTQQQARQLLQKACRYYLLFHKQANMNAVDIFMSVCTITSQAVKYSMFDQLLLFLRIAHKLGSKTLLKTVSRQDWSQKIFDKLKTDTMVGVLKDQVFPFNPLNLKQLMVVDAGNKVQKVIQIYQQYSLFYYTLLVQSHDVNLSLHYLGDFQSKLEVRKQLVAEHKVSGVNKSAFVATRKGIYMLQFDNSFSWVNSKSIKFEYVVLTPYQHLRNPAWLDRMLDQSSSVQQPKQDEYELQPKQDEYQLQPREDKYQLQQEQGSLSQQKEQKQYEEQQVSLSQNQQSQQDQQQAQKKKAQQERIRRQNKQKEQRVRQQRQLRQKKQKEQKRKQEKEAKLKLEREAKIKQEKQLKEKQERQLKQKMERQAKEKQQEQLREKEQRQAKERQAREMKEKQARQQQQKQKQIKKRLEKQLKLKQKQQKQQKLKQQKQQKQKQKQKIKSKVEPKNPQKQQQSIMQQPLVNTKKVQKAVKVERSTVAPQAKPNTQILSQKSIKSSTSLEDKQGIQQTSMHANLTLIDGMFSLLATTHDHTYQFQTNLQDKIYKRIKAYCQSTQSIQWIFNAQARVWLKKKGFSSTTKAGITLLSIQTSK